MNALYTCAMFRKRLNETIPIGTLVKFHSSQINNITTPHPRAKQVCQAKLFRLFKQASGGLTGTKELLF